MRVALVLVLSLSSLACGGASATVRPTAEVAPAEEAPVEEAPVEDLTPRAWLFRVTRGDTPPSYLFGTMHIGITFRDALPTPLDSALFEARAVAMEVDPREAMRYFREAPRVSRPRREWLDRAMTRESWERLSTELGRVAPVEILRRLDPGFLTLYFLQVRMAEVEAAEDGRTPVPGAVSSTRLDRSIFDWTIASGVPFVPLETPEEAMSAFAGLESGSAIEALQRMVDDPEGSRLEAAGLRDAYRSLDAERLLAALSEMTEAQRHAMLDSRNQAWMPHLLPELEQGNVFVAVGCGHLLGPGSIVELLEAEGYVIERVLGDGGLTPSESNGVIVGKR